MMRNCHIGLPPENYGVLWILTSMRKIGADCEEMDKDDPETLDREWLRSIHNVRDRKKREKYLELLNPALDVRRVRRIAAEMHARRNFVDNSPAEQES